MLPIARGVFGPRLDKSFSYCSLAPHTLCERQIRSTPFASAPSSLSDAAADGIEVQYRNLFRPSRQNSAQQQNCRKTANQHSMKTHHPPHSSHPWLGANTLNDHRKLLHGHPDNTRRHQVEKPFQIIHFNSSMSLRRCTRPTTFKPSQTPCEPLSCVRHRGTLACPFLFAHRPIRDDVQTRPAPRTKRTTNKLCGNKTTRSANADFCLVSLTKATMPTFEHGG
jgi:hypothetical protein